MSVTEADIKKLWGKAAGRCCFRGCGIDCIPFLDQNTPTVIGEMAHVIAKNADGPRGNSETINDNSYDNLILLCPTHHTIVDKAPEMYTRPILLEMKRACEIFILDSLQINLKFSSLNEFCNSVSKILMQNKIVWRDFGPESKIALEDPCSNMADYWILRKLDTIVPNNKKIISLIKNNESLLDSALYSLAVEFIEHAKSFEHNCYCRIGHAKRFPMEFEKEILRHV